jgi:hypothetical protein
MVLHWCRYNAVQLRASGHRRASCCEQILLLVNSLKPLTERHWVPIEGYLLKYICEANHSDKRHTTMV